MPRQRAGGPASSTEPRRDDPPQGPCVLVDRGVVLARSRRAPRPASAPPRPGSARQLETRSRGTRGRPERGREPLDRLVGRARLAALDLGDVLLREPAPASSVWVSPAETRSCRSRSPSRTSRVGSEVTPCARRDTRTAYSRSESCSRNPPKGTASGARRSQRPFPLGSQRRLDMAGADAVKSALTLRAARSAGRRGQERIGAIWMTAEPQSRQRIDCVECAPPDGEGPGAAAGPPPCQLHRLVGRTARRRDRVSYTASATPRQRRRGIGVSGVVQVGWTCRPARSHGLPRRARARLGQAPSRPGATARTRSRSPPSSPPSRWSIVASRPPRDEDPGLGDRVAVGVEHPGRLTAADHVGEEVVHLADLRRSAFAITGSSEASVSAWIQRSTSRSLARLAM